MRVLIENHVDSHADVLGDWHARAIVQLLKSRDLRFGEINRRGDLFTCHTPRVPGINTGRQASQVVFLKFRLKYKKMFKVILQAFPPLMIPLLGLLGACSTSSPSNSASAQVKPIASDEAGIELIAPDARTHNPRQRRVFQDIRGKKILARVESDFNGDGRIDFIQAFDPTGSWIQLEKSDLDGDGRFDVTYVFTWDSSRKEPRLSEQSFDTNYDGRIDLWKEFDGRSRLTLRKLDRNFDDRADYWEYYDNGQAVRIEQDSDYDGKPDLIPTPRTSRR